MAGDNIYDIYQDRSGTIWIPCYGGVYPSEPRNEEIAHANLLYTILKSKFPNKSDRILGIRVSQQGLSKL
ncbi:hypothetical protein IH992_33150 [Candidatus Poribacteria bacterium]|nr:hypothetical protein [Candidatus Poribacteria bacterium]